LELLLGDTSSLFRVGSDDIMEVDIVGVADGNGEECSCCIVVIVVGIKVMVWLIITVGDLDMDEVAGDELSSFIDVDATVGCMVTARLIPDDVGLESIILGVGIAEK
jgi:hypothetical protein